MVSTCQGLACVKASDHDPFELTLQPLQYLGQTDHARYPTLPS